MAKIVARYIKDEDSFKAWLETRPEVTRAAEAVSLAHRAAMRVVPYLSRLNILGGAYSDLLNSVFRASISSRVAVKFPTSETAVASANTSDVHLSESSFDDADPSPRSANAVFSAAVSASAYASNLNGLPNANFYEYAYATVDVAARAAVVQDELWIEIRYDADRLSSGVSTSKLITAPLWTDKKKWLFRQESALYSNLDKVGDGLSIWIDWYKSISAGGPAWGLPEKIADELELRIALGGSTEKYDGSFWDREPKVINAEIAAWLKEARAIATVPVQQGNGLRFEPRAGRVSISKYFGLTSLRDDRIRIESNLPQLAELASLLKAELTKRDAPYPDLLHVMLNKFQELVNRPATDIEPDMLFAASSLLRGQVDSAMRQSGMSNAPPIEGGELALARSITMISDLVVMGTERGKELFRDADQVERDAGVDEQFNAKMKEVFEMVRVHGEIMQKEAVDIVIDLLTHGHLSPHPRRAVVFAHGSARNALQIIGLLALLSWLGGNATSVAGFFVDKVVDVSIIYSLSSEAREAINDFMRKNAAKLREVSREVPSLKWINDLLDVLDKKDRNRD